MPTASAKPWTTKPEGAFHYTSSDTYLQSLAGKYPGQLSQSVAEFIRNPYENFKEYLEAEKNLKGKIPKISDQKPIDVTEVFQDSSKTSLIFGKNSADDKQIFAIKIPFRYQKWLTDEAGGIIREDHQFLDGTTKLLPVMDQHEPILFWLSTLCGSSKIGNELIDVRNFSTDEILAFENGFFGIKVREMKAVLKILEIDQNSDNSALLFTGTAEDIQQKVDFFIEKFNALSAHGIASITSTQQMLLDSFSGNSPKEKAENLLVELSKRAHPMFPQSVFAVALKEGLVITCIEAVGILNDWHKSSELKRLYQKVAFEALFWNSGEWVKLFYEYSSMPTDYKKLTAGLKRGKDEVKILEYLKKVNIDFGLIDLGIGTGRELKDFEDLEHLKKIVGIDYSQIMLDFCEKEWEGYKVPITYVRDDFTTLETAKKYIEQVELPKIFTVFFGTINNTLPHTRAKLLRTIKKLMMPADRLIIDFSKIPPEQMVDYTHPWLKFKRPEDHRTFYDVQLYVGFEWFWRAAKEYFNSTPQFFYDKNTQNMMITVTGVGQCFFSHRYTEPEIRELYNSAGLNLEEFVEGDEMYITVAKL